MDTEIVCYVEGVHLKKGSACETFYIWTRLQPNPYKLYISRKFATWRFRKKFQTVKSCIKVALHRLSIFGLNFTQEKIGPAVYYEISLFIHFLNTYIGIIVLSIENFD